MKSKYLMDRNQEEIAESKRKRVQSKNNKDLPRFQCFCAKQYLSYPALYLHLKNKHPKYFFNSKNGKRMEPTKLIETIDPVEGFKVHKISPDSLLDSDKQDMDFFPPKSFEHKPFNENMYYSGVPPPYLSYYQPQNYPFDPHLMYAQQFGQKHQEESVPEQREADIEKALSMFLDSQKTISSPKRQQIELILLMFVDCLNRNYELLKDQRISQKEVRRYTSEYNCEKMFNMVRFFEENYIQQYLKNQKPATFFFLTHSSIIRKQGMKALFDQIYQFIHDKPPELPPQQELLQALEGQSSECEGEGSSENEDEQDENENIEQKKEEIAK